MCTSHLSSHQYGIIALLGKVLLDKTVSDHIIAIIANIHYVFKCTSTLNILSQLILTHYHY
jgi:hypothetical protein